VIACPVRLGGALSFTTYAFAASIDPKQDVNRARYGLIEKLRRHQYLYAHAALMDHHSKNILENSK